MGEFGYILLYIFGVFYLVRPITVLLHELGHALSWILVTRKNVTIYLGSYGDPDNSFKLRLGLLNIWFRANPIYWTKGLCAPSASTSINKQIFATFAGPLMSFIIALICFYFAFYFDIHGSIKFALAVFLGAAIVDLFENLSPKEEPVTPFSGKEVYNDGYQIRKLLYLKRYSKDIKKAAEFYNKKDFKNAVVIYKKMIDKGVKRDEIYRMAISSYINLKDWAKARQINDKFKLTKRLYVDDFLRIALPLSHLEQHNEALEYYNKALALEPKNTIALNNIGFTLNELERFNEALPYFNQILELDDSFVDAYNNGGYANLKMGNEFDGLRDIKQALQLKPEYSYALRNRGIFHLDRKEYNKALEYFVKAKDQDASTFRIDNYINLAKAGLK